jgi:Glycosyl hydrolases family 38 N-terminal domain/Glycosyl hydrolases family 38 C-terminal domain
MTQGLLNSAFHDKAHGERRRDLVEFRSQLTAAAFETVGRLGGGPVLAADLPLFTRRPHGLHQVVRFLAPLDAPQGLRLWADGAATANGQPWVFHRADGHLVADALVPEVSSPQAMTFRVGTEAEPVLCEARVHVRPQRKWEISLVHHTHLDVGYTDRQEVVLANHLQYLDDVLDLVDRTDDWPDDARFRWNIEVSWPLERWFRARPELDRARLLDAVGAGRVSIGAMSLNVHTEACAIEELFEMVRFAVELRREHGIPVVSAMQTDVPGGVTGLVEVLADAGVRYLSVAHNYAGRSVPYLIGGDKLERPFYWVAPSGKRLLVWQTDTLHGNAYMEGNIVGLAESLDAAEANLPNYLVALASKPYPFDSGTWLPEAEKVDKEPYRHDILHLRVQGKYGDNAPPNVVIAEVARDWNERWAFPRLRVDTNEGFFSRAEERLGDAIPEWQGDWADWWADGLGSGARMLGWARQAQGLARAARSLSAVADVLEGKEKLTGADLGPVYESISLFDEHTWGARHPWEDDEDGWGSGSLQWQHKATFARAARQESEALAEAAMRRLGSVIGGGGGVAGVVVFNPSGWPRDDVVKVFVPFSAAGPDVEVCLQDDRDGAKVVTLEVPQEHIDHRPLGRFLYFRATNVPPCGYARYNVVEGGGERAVDDAQAAPVVANQYYRVVMSPGQGTIASVQDKAAGRELVNPDALLGFNAYVFDRYATATRVDHLSGRVFSRALDLVADRSAASGAIVAAHRTSPLGQSVTLDIRAPGVSRLLSTVTLWDGVPRVDVHNRMWKEKTVDKQSVFFAFPFAVPRPHLAYELPGCGTSADAPAVPGCPQHMRAVRHWVSLQGSAGVTAWATLDAPLVQFGDIHSPYSPFPGSLPLAQPEPATVYSWALNNIWDTNFPTEQGGEMNFRYAIASGPAGAGDEPAVRLGEALSSPLSASVVPATARAARPAAATGSLCRVAPPVRLVQVAAGRDGEALALWLNNLGGGRREAVVEFVDFQPSSARRATVFEADGQDLVVTGRTVRLTLEAGETRALVVRGRWSPAPGA